MSMMRDPRALVTLELVTNVARAQVPSDESSGFFRADTNVIDLDEIAYEASRYETPEGPGHLPGTVARP